LLAHLKNEPKYPVLPWKHAEHKVIYKGFGKHSKTPYSIYLSARRSEKLQRNDSN